MVLSVDVVDSVVGGGRVPLERVAHDLRATEDSDDRYIGCTCCH